MENSAFKKWLKRRVAREAAANVFLASLALAASVVVLGITFFFSYAVVWFGFNLGVASFSRLLFNSSVHISHPMILLVCWVFVVLLFIGNARTSREYLDTLPKRNYVPSASMPGGVFGALGTLLAYPGASARMITDLLFTGPRLVVVAWGALKKALRLVRMDIEGCSRVLAVLGSSDSRVSCDELAELSAVPDADRVLSQLRDIDGVVFLSLEPPGLTLTSELREELPAVLGNQAGRGATAGNVAAGTICELLGVPSDASFEEIETAYERWIRQAPPDRNSRSAKESQNPVEDQVRAINAAYEAFLARRKADAGLTEDKAEKVEGLWQRYQRRGE